MQLICGYAFGYDHPLFADSHLPLKVTHLEILKEKKYLLKNCLIYIISFSKIDGFVEPSSQIDGFGRTH